MFAAERFHQCTLGHRVTVLSDHKPLENITKKPSGIALKILQGMMLRLQWCDVEMVVRPKSQEEFKQVNMAQYLPIMEPRLREIKDATEHDEVLQVLKPVILQGWPDEKHDLATSVMPFFSFREQLTTQVGFIFKGNRVVIPNSLRRLMKEKIHSSHMGIDSCHRTWGLTHVIAHGD